MHKDNNFDSIRLFFALSVIITHSYALTGVSEENDLLFKLTKTISFSVLGVSGFFAISGYLILESLKRSRGLGDYFTKRALRIFPGMFVVLLVTAIIGYFVTTVPKIEYLTNMEAIMYLVRNLTLVNMTNEIKGVYEDNPFKKVINGSIWTIQYEFLFYVLLAFLYPFRTNKKLLAVLIGGAFLVVLAHQIRYINGDFQFMFNRMVPLTSFRWWGLSNFGLYFAAGAFLSAVEIHHFKFKNLLLLGSLLLIVTTMATGTYDGQASYLLLPTIVIICGLGATKGLIGFNKKTGGDLSYGIYLYGFLIQQTIIHFFPSLDALALMLLAIPVAMVCGYLSWNLVEKYPLRLKGKKLNARPPVV